MAQVKLKSAPPIQTNLGRRLFRIGLLLSFVLVVIYFVLSSSWFIEAVILPRVGIALNSKFTAQTVELSPFSEVTARGIKLTPNDADTLLTATSLHVRYSLFAILRGNLNIEEFALESPVITIVENANGSSNLDPIKVAGGAKPPAPPATAPAKSTQRVDIKSITLKNATIKHVKNFKNGDRVTSEIANLSFSAGNIQNGKGGRFNISADMLLDKFSGTNNSKMPALLNGGFTFALLDDLKVADVKGTATFTVGRAFGEFSEFTGMIARLDSEMTFTDVKQFSLRFNKGPAMLGEVRASGPFDAEKTEGKLKVEILSIDRQVLNLFGAARGIDFGTTRINGTTDIEFAKAGRLVSAVGRLEVARLQFIQNSQASPTLDLRCNYDFTFDRAGNNILLKAFNLDGTQNQRQLLQANLASPMTIAFGEAANVPDSSLDFSLTDLSLADWRVFAPDLALAGLASGRVKLISTDGGKQLNLAVDETLKNFSAKTGDNLLNIGEISFKGTITRKQTGQSFKGDLALHNIQIPGKSGALFEAALDIDTTVSNKVVELSRCSLKLTPTARATNEISLTGQVNLTNPTAIAGNLKLAADALDVTAYYDLFDTKPARKEKADAQPTSTSAPDANKEPAAVKLPFANFTAEANIGHLYLREVDAANFQAKLVLDGSRVVLDPFQLTLNNAPINATANLDLGEPGYKYDVAFKADGVPVEPLANSFSSTYQGKARGTLLGNIQLKGAGTTGVNLKKNLTGAADLNFTNADIQIDGKWIKPIVTGLALALNSPELLKSPLDYVTVGIRAGEGKIEIPAFIAESAALHIESVGTIPIADVLADSPLNQTIEVSLARDLAGKLSFANVPTNVAYMKLPRFAELKGTLGSVEAKVDKSRLIGMTAVGVSAGVLNAVLGGKSSQTNSATAGTNAPGTTTTNQPKQNLLDLLRKTK